MDKAPPNTNAKEHSSLPLYDSFWAIKQPELIDTSKIETDGGQWINLPNGRIVEYYTCGSEASDATILVDCHGGSCTGKMFSTFPDWVAKCIELNVRVISPTFPGFGYSTIQPGRFIKDWPVDDLLPILQKEGVKEFLVTGTSFGSPHALATAWQFSKKMDGQPLCKGMGLRVPYMGSETCAKLGLKNHLTVGYTSKSANTTIIGHYLARFVTAMQSEPSAVFKTPGPLMKLFMNILNPGALSAVAKLKEEYPELMKLVMVSVDRSVVHTEQGNLYNYATETLVDHGFDVQEIQTDLPLVVWYADDDEDCPPSHAEWLASGKHFVMCDSRVFSGYGHVGGAFIDQPEYLDALVNKVRANA